MTAAPVFSSTLLEMRWRRFELLLEESESNERLDCDTANRRLTPLLLDTGGSAAAIDWSAELVAASTGLRDGVADSLTRLLLEDD